MSETKRWLIGLLLTACIGATGLYLKFSGPQLQGPTEIKVVLDPASLVTEGNAVSLATRIPLGADPTPERRSEAREQAVARARQVAFEAKVAEISDEAGGLQENVAEEVLAQDPEMFFAAEPEIHENVVDEELVVEVEFRWDEDKLRDALGVIEEIVESYRCPGLGENHPRHRIMVVYREGGDGVANRTSTPARKAVSELNKALKKRGFDTFDRATMDAFYAKVEEEAGRVLGPNEFLGMAVDLKKNACAYLFVRVTVYPEDGGGTHEIETDLSISCQDPEGAILGEDSRSGTRNWTGPFDAINQQREAAEAVEELAGTVLFEVLEQADLVR